MLDYCKEACTDRGTEGCALPTLPERIVLHSKSAGALMLDRYTRAAALINGHVVPSDPMGTVEAAQTEAAIKYTPAEVCAYLRTIE